MNRLLQIGLVALFTFCLVGCKAGGGPSPPTRIAQAPVDKAPLAPVSSPPASEKEQRDHALIAALRSDDTASAMVLLKAGADANACDTDAANPTATPSPALFLALFWRTDTQGNLVVLPENLPLIQMLLDKGAQVNARGADGTTALIMAAQQHKTQTVKLLLKYGADPCAQDLVGRTALVFAADMSSQEMLNALIDKGAKINAPSPQGNTILMFAAMSGNTPIVETLLKRGASVNYKTAGGDSALAVARRHNRTEIITVLKHAGATE